MKLPGSSTNQTEPGIVNAFVHVNDMTPTFLDYARVQPPGLSYNGHPVHAIMRKSLQPLLEGKVEKAYGDNEPVAQEIFNNTAVWMGDWKAVKNFQPVGDGQWHLFNITADIGENNDLASQHPDTLDKMMADYDKFAKDVGMVVPSATIEAFQTLGMSSD